MTTALSRLVAAFNSWQKDPHYNGNQFFADIAELLPQIEAEFAELSERNQKLEFAQGEAELADKMALILLREAAKKEATAACIANAELQKENERLNVAVEALTITVPSQQKEITQLESQLAATREQNHHLENETLKLIGITTKLKRELAEAQRETEHHQLLYRNYKTLVEKQLADRDAEKLK